MKIVLAAGIFPPDIGGPATYTKKIADHFASLHHDVIVVCYGDRTETDNRGAYPVYRIGRNQNKLATFISYCRALWSVTRKAHMIYAQGPISGGIQSYLISRLRRCSYIVKVTGDYAWEQGTASYGILTSIDDFQSVRSGLPKKIAIVRFLQKFICTHARRVIVPSQYLRTMVRGWGVERFRVVVIYNAIDPIDRESVVDKQTYRMSLSFTTAPLVLAVGRLVPWKGFSCLIESWPHILERVPGAQLAIVGSGPDEDMLRRMIQTERMEEFITLMGQKNKRDISLLYDISDMFVLNSGYEGLSHVILEAMTHDLPCAVSNSGGNKELIKHEISGLLFTHDSKAEIIETLVRMLTNPDETRRYAVAAKSSLDKFSYDAMTASTLDLIGGLVYRDTHRTT